MASVSLPNLTYTSLNTVQASHVTDKYPLRKLVLLPDSFVAGMELKRSQTQDTANWTCFVNCRVRRKSFFDQRRATPVEMCQVILLLTAPYWQIGLSDGNNNRECCKKIVWKVGLWRIWSCDHGRSVGAASRVCSRRYSRKQWKD